MSQGTMWLLLSLLVGSAHGVQVETKYGTVEGDTLLLVDSYHAGIEVNTFLSIPFARPPVDELRFAVSSIDTFIYMGMWGRQKMRRLIH